MQGYVEAGDFDAFVECQKCSWAVPYVGAEESSALFAQIVSLLHVAMHHPEVLEKVGVPRTANDYLRALKSFPGVVEFFTDDELRQMATEPQAIRVSMN